MSSSTPPPLSPIKPSFPPQAVEWKSIVRSHELIIEHAAIDIKTYRELYHMELTLSIPLPSEMELPGQWLCLSWPYGGLWKIVSVSDNNTKIKCLSWRKIVGEADFDATNRLRDVLASKVLDDATTEDPDHVEEDNEEEPDHEDEEDGEEVENEEAPEMNSTLFYWTMMRGEWKSDKKHWFLRDIDPPYSAEDEEEEEPEEEDQVEPKKELLVKLFVGFRPLEASIEVNAVTSVDTVSQTYAADLTWQVVLPAITSLRDDTALREFLDLLEIDAEQFEFTNVSSMSEQRDLATSLTPAGDVEFRFFGLQDTAATNEEVHNLTFSRRIRAEFKTEMDLHSFPFDQQGLVFEFSTGTGMANDTVLLVPKPVDPGIFPLENFQLGNVFDLLYNDKVFVGYYIEWGAKKYICFQTVLQRRSGYYLTNVALIATIITYLCFVAFATDEDGTPMDIASRLQIVSALVLTAVTFKNQVAELIPRVSYFTLLDKYVFMCFLVMVFVMLENAFFPTLKQRLGVRSDKSLLGFSVGMFTLINIVWALYIQAWLSTRDKVAKTFTQVHEYIRQISRIVPITHRPQVFERFLESKRYSKWRSPQYMFTSTGDIHVFPPTDEKDDTAYWEKKWERAKKQETKALEQVPEIEKLYLEMCPDADLSVTVLTVDSSSALPSPAETKTFGGLPSPAMGHHRRPTNLGTPTQGTTVDLRTSRPPIRTSSQRRGSDATKGDRPRRGSDATKGDRPRRGSDATKGDRPRRNSNAGPKTPRRDAK